MDIPESSIIGLGRLGKALTQALLVEEIPVKSVFNRTENKARQLAEASGVNIWGGFPESSDQLGKVVFITVSDDAIEETARRLSRLNNGSANRMYVHCSGNESADLLQPLKAVGATVASFHPLQTFTTHATPDDFNGIYFTMQGNPEAFPLLENMADHIGAETFEVTKEQKSHLHTAAVMGANYLTTILNRAVDIGTLSGLADDKVRMALLPLIRNSLKNSEDYSFSEALTGPIKRGDIVTIKKHISLLEDQPELQNLYCMLGLHTVRLVEESGDLEATVVEKMRTIFG